MARRRMRQNAGIFRVLLSPRSTWRGPYEPREPDGGCPVTHGESLDEALHIARSVLTQSGQWKYAYILAPSGLPAAVMVNAPWEGDGDRGLRCVVFERYGIASASLLSTPGWRPPHEIIAALYEENRPAALEFLRARRENRLPEPTPQSQEDLLTEASRLWVIERLQQDHRNSFQAFYGFGFLQRYERVGVDRWEREPDSVLVSCWILPSANANFLRIAVSNNTTTSPPSAISDRDALTIWRSATTYGTVRGFDDIDADDIR